MKKAFPFIVAAVLLLTSCSNDFSSMEDSVTEEGIVGEETEESAQRSYTAAELEQMRLNAGSSITDNSINLKSDYPGRILYVPETDTLFYMQDDVLYQKNGDSTIVLVELPAVSINLYEGKLYFVNGFNRDIVYNYHERFGDVRCLDLSTGELTEVIDADNISKISLIDGQLYYTETDKNDNDAILPTNTFVMDTITGDIEKITDVTYSEPYAVSEKYRVFTHYSNIGEEISVEVEITDRSGAEITRFTEDKWLDRLSLYGDKLYYIYGSSLKCFDIGTMTEEVFAAPNHWGSDTAFIMYYFILNDTLFFSAGTDLNMVSEDGKLIYFSPDDSFVFFNEYYAGGENIYGLDRYGKLRRLGLEGMNGISVFMQDGTSINGKIIIHDMES